MKKINISSILLYAIFPIVFNVIVFILATESTTTFWISYVFIHFSYITLISSSVFIPKTKNRLVFGYPIAYISSVYFFVELLMGLYFFTIGKNQILTSIVIQLVITGIYGVIFTLSFIVDKKIVMEEEKRQKDIMYIKIAGDEMIMIMKQVKGVKAKKKVETVYDAIKSSQVRTYPSLAGIEINIIELIKRLEVAVVHNVEEDILSLSGQILALLDERNRKIRFLH